MRDIEEIRRVSKIYDDRAQVTDSIKAAGQWGNKELVNEITQEIIKKMDIKSEDIILEIGCGSGVLGNVVEENCKSYYGFDASKFMLKKFESEYDTNYTYNLIQASATEIPFKDEQFDKIIMNGVSMYFPNNEFLSQVLNEIIRVAKKKSKILIGENIIPSKYCWELVWFENLSHKKQIFAREYIKIRRWLARKNSKLAGKWKTAHQDISPKFVKEFFKNCEEFSSSDAAAYTVRKRKGGEKIKGNRRIDFIIKLNK